MDETIIKSKDAKSNICITSIKSSYILKNIFSFLKIENLLNLIIYNKQLQKEYGYNIENYKEKSGKYRIYNKYGSAEVYILNTKIKIFEGEYLNGKRNGKGKEYYDNGKLKFEGEYLNGKREGKGEEYYDNDKLVLEKKYLNNISNRKILEYDNDSVNFDINPGLIGDESYIDEKTFDNLNSNEGEYLNEVNGKFKEYNNYNVNLKFKGEYLNGKRNGKGKEYFKNGKLKFEGEYLNGERWNGKGYNINGKMEFEIKNGKGNIKEYDYDGKLKFEGE